MDVEPILTGSNMTKTENKSYQIDEYHMKEKEVKSYDAGYQYAIDIGHEKDYR